jgi:hypothetical protein
MSQYHNSGYGYNNPGSFNISQPIDNFNQSVPSITSDDVDQYGYIRNESRNVDICVRRYPDGRLEFVAIDGDGEEVHDYELPNDDLLDTVEIKPMSKYAYDTYQRKYRIIDIDYDNPAYDNATNDDKYDY